MTTDTLDRRSVLRLAAFALAGSPLRAIAKPADARPAPEISAEHWLNSAPLSIAELRGDVVLLEFFTFACWNCQNVEPYIQAWHERYRGEGLRVVAVHCPEFDHEKKLENVRRYLSRRSIAYPVAIDNRFATWKRYGNRYWPTMYLIDRKGQIRYVRIGEGGYEETERKLQELLAEHGTLEPKQP